MEKVFKKKDLSKRAKSKFLTGGLAYRLAMLHGPLEKSYWNTFHCSSELTQTGKKLTTQYCNNRWCNVCNRIRTAKLIDGYTPELNKLHNKHFVTLTVPNCKASELFSTLRLMMYSFVKVRDRLRKRKIKLRGIRKIEITYNRKENTFHPHFHFIIEGKVNATALMDEWVKVYPGAKLIAQDVREADDSSVKELFKYFTKLLSKGTNNRIYLEALDLIFQVMRGSRVFQPLGIKKYVPEDIEEIQGMLFEDLQETTVTMWKWENNDWYDIQTGEELTGYTPTFKDMKFLNQIE